MIGDGTVKEVNSKEELDELLRRRSPAIVYFFASRCEASKQMDQVFSHLCTDFPYAYFFRVEAEEQLEISEAFSVSAVPYFVFCKDNKVVDTLEGANPASLANKVAKIAGSVDRVESAAPASLGMAAGPTILETVKELVRENEASVAENLPSGFSDSLTSRLQQLVDSNPVFLFMKGTPDQPKCGFSQKVVDILKDEGIEFGSFDIFADNDVCEGVKKFSNWPTFPQLFCKGEFIGGCDIAAAMHESGELKEILRDHGVVALSAAVTETPETEKDYGKSGGSADATGLSASLTSRLKTIINRSSVVLFMKGTPEEPRCSFSREAVEILQHEKVQFSTFDILSDEEVRQGLKVFSNWSSYPQLYVKGELIGGSDIMLEMEKSGELERILAEKGII
ncbi:unnamed protein product [Spirodela intermedia]|uniref:Uncharacterized protein n=1 Tax=Spirodela intermedia TaxID=51605 RepID=A0A7I8K489_SPIIN|nr:unnamed protein product [Spirodela intermedia]